MTASKSYQWCIPRLVLVTFGVLPFIAMSLVRADNTTCASGQLDWYTSVVGETPCATYQRLRQICNNDYRVPRLRPTPPGDQCDDQVATCCCNTVAFQLSMLCMNCQHDDLPGDQIGIDAVPGTYAHYRGACGAGNDHSLNADIQRAVCNLGIRLDDFLYRGWDDGAWFYVWTKENAERQHAVANNNTFTHCPSQVSQASASSLASGISTISLSDTATSTASLPSQTAVGGGATSDGNGGGSRLSTGANAAIGGVVGGGGILLLAGAGFIFWRKYTKRRGSHRAPSQMYTASRDRAPETSMVTPFLIVTPNAGDTTTKAYYRF